MAIIKRFSYADGYHGVVDAQISGEVCDALSEKGLLTAANLVDVSRPEDAPLHSVFEWVDSVAAEKWRVALVDALVQALPRAYDFSELVVGVDLAVNPFLVRKLV